MFPDLNSVDAEYFERRNICEALCQNMAGVAFLQWLCRLTGFNKPSMSMEDAARRDIWLTLRPYIPVDKLGEIEHYDLRLQQQREKDLYELAGIMEDQANE